MVGTCFSHVSAFGEPWVRRCMICREVMPADIKG